MSTSTTLDPAHVLWSVPEPDRADRRCDETAATASSVTRRNRQRPRPEGPGRVHEQKEKPMIRSVALVESHNRRLRMLLALLAVAAATAVLAACRSSGTSATSGSSSSSSPAAAAAGSLKTATIGGVTVLTNSKG